MSVKVYAAGVVAAALLATSAAAVEPIKPIRVVSPLDSIASLRGDVELRSNDQVVSITLRSEAGDFFYKVEADSLAGVPGAFHSDVADLYLWRGNLIIAAAREGRAWHFLIPEAYFPETEGQRELRPAVQGLIKGLDERFDVVRIDTATAIIDRKGSHVTPFELDASGELRRSVAKDTEYQDPGSGGVGGCGTTCSQSCADGSSCQATCGPNRCASCSCPASCSCS